MVPFIQTGPQRRFTTPGTTSASLALNRATGPLDTIRVVNATNQTIGVAFGVGSATADLTDNAASQTVAVASGQASNLRVPMGTNFVAVIAVAVSTGNAFVIPGDGGN